MICDVRGGFDFLGQKLLFLGYSHGSRWLSTRRINKKSLSPPALCPSRSWIIFGSWPFFSLSSKKLQARNQHNGQRESRKILDLGQELGPSFGTPNWLRLKTLSVVWSTATGDTYKRPAPHATPFHRSCRPVKSLQQLYIYCDLGFTRSSFAGVFHSFWRVIAASKIQGLLSKLFRLGC